ncbi:LysR family transcriptional regulator [Pseudomonas sp. RGM2987]|uniref:LysR family transcriptional regulator n=1 Tax=Pseudomonas sp. RGM2987 TaxID=2930090 RepID=UPI001FD6E665|nr:LysR family transcriptional regulator [Pseudomonas sp. RGM2987]MCJ8207970.1 LysR family transcriptional regulator [Pseudomonas sp. RGM2987]
MDTFNLMTIFIAIADRGSFTGAADTLGTSVANVSRAMAQLETHLKAKLVNRTTRKLSLTEAGMRYLAKCEAVIDLVRDAEQEAGSAQNHPSGRIKVHAMTSIGHHFVIRAAVQYKKSFPDVTFNIMLANRIPDLVSEGFDISVVIASELSDSGLISQKLGDTYSVVCASPEYVQLHGAVQTPADLKHHDCLRIVSDVSELHNWRFHGPNGEEAVTIRNAALDINTADGLIAAINLGMGVGVLPIYTANPGLRNGSLVRLLPEYKLQELSVFAVYPSRQYLDAKIRTWVELLKKMIPEILSDQDGHCRTL